MFSNRLNVLILSHFLIDLKINFLSFHIIAYKTNVNLIYSKYSIYSRQYLFLNIIHSNIHASKLFFSIYRLKLCFNKFLKN
jgi:hypothetical protein